MINVTVQLHITEFKKRAIRCDFYFLFTHKLFASCLLKFQFSVGGENFFVWQAEVCVGSHLTVSLSNHSYFKATSTRHGFLDSFECYSVLCHDWFYCEKTHVFRKTLLQSWETYYCHFLKFLKPF